MRVDRTDSNLMVTGLLTPRPVVIRHSPAWDTAQPLGTDSRRQKSDPCCPDRKALGERCDKTWDTAPLRVCYKSYSPQVWGCNTFTSRLRLRWDIFKVESHLGCPWNCVSHTSRERTTRNLRKVQNSYRTSTDLRNPFSSVPSFWKCHFDLFWVHSFEISWKLQSLFQKKKKKGTTNFQTISGDSWAP